MRSIFELGEIGSYNTWSDVKLIKQKTGGKSLRIQCHLYLK